MLLMLDNRYRLGLGLGLAVIVKGVMVGLGLAVIVKGMMVGLGLAVIVKEGLGLGLPSRKLIKRGRSPV